jgi:hypothetical protein
MKTSPAVLAFVFASLLIAAGALGQEPAAQKFLLKEVPPAVGDVSVRAAKNNSSMQIRAVPEGSNMAVLDAPYVSNSQEKYVQSVLAVSGINPTYYTRRYAIAKETKTQKLGEPEKSVVLPRQGKTLTIRVKNGRRYDHRRQGQAAGGRAEGSQAGARAEAGAAGVLSEA